MALTVRMSASAYVNSRRRSRREPCVYFSGRNPLLLTDLGLIEKRRKGGAVLLRSQLAELHRLWHYVQLRNA